MDVKYFLENDIAQQLDNPLDISDLALEKAVSQLNVSPFDIDKAHLFVDNNSWYEAVRAYSYLCALAGKMCDINNVKIDESLETDAWLLSVNNKLIYSEGS